MTTQEILTQAKEAAQRKKSEIIEAKKESWENTEHAITNLWTSDGFEALAELSQYVNPVTDKIIDYEEQEHRIHSCRKRQNIHCPPPRRLSYVPGA